MSEGVAFREMRPDESAPVAALWQAAGVARPWNDPAKDIAFALREDHSTVLVGEKDGRIVASAMVGEDGHRGWVYYVAVDPELQRSGLGVAIMAAAERWLAARGVWKVHLLVREDNAGVKMFYERLGYRDTRTVCMQKVIGE